MADACLREFVRMLRARRSSPGGLAGVDASMAGLQVEPSSLKPYLHFLPGRYTRNLVHRDEGLEVIVNCWSPGVSSPIHDHDGQECWFSVQRGQFLLENYPLLEGGTGPGVARLGAPERVGPVGPGHVDFRDAGAPIHRVCSTSAPGVTLHVYAGPVAQCLVFDPRRNRCAAHSLRYHSIFGRPVRPDEGRAGLPLSL
ncbi:cysteine dioxygenase [Corallococcus praedator]|uniref:Cysteine dioxygenase n=2 Tax=Myxococcaceae TaxID=31 RepID=A0ABX9QBJ1_9BACT|nr:cysteine dioxygenase [Corallococcus sp. CA031C]RKH99914.1 cysteine dioxygenase [Corallococcus praedator]